MRRVYWQADLTPGKDEPLFCSLVKYQMDEDRQPSVTGNLISSHILGSDLHAPILDLDIPHTYTKSTSDGHGHLYLNLPMSRFKMFVMLAALRYAGVIEMGNFWWSLRRGGTFVRRRYVRKPESENLPYTYGMFFKLRRKK